MIQTRSLSEFSCLSEYTRLYPIGYKLILEDELCALYMHFLVVGCDKTTSVFGIGKGLALKKYLKDCNFRKCTSVFTKSEVISMDDIINYGEKAMTIQYGGKPE